jgi:hypothetical protein
MKAEMKNTFVISLKLKREILKMDLMVKEMKKQRNLEVKWRMMLTKECK